MDQKPGKVTAIAITQLASGVINLFFMSWAMVTGMSIFAGLCTAVTMGLGFLSAFCAVVPLALLPIGLIEIISGIIGLAAPKSAGLLSKIVAGLEIFSVFFGGFGSLIAGIVTVVLGMDPEVKAYFAPVRPE